MMRPGSIQGNAGTTSTSGYKSMIGFAGNKDVGNYAMSIQDSANAGRSLRYQPANFVKFRRATQKALEAEGSRSTSTSPMSGIKPEKRRIGVITTLNANPDPMLDLYSKSLKKMTSFYRKGVI